MQEDRKALRAARIAAREARIAARAAGRPLPPPFRPIDHAAPAAIPTPPSPVRAAGAPPLPPVPLAARVAGTEDMIWFDKSGATSLNNWHHALRAIGRTIDSFPRIMDFGCGCGRVLRHLRGAMKSEQELIGVDVDGEAVAWVNANLAGITAHQLGLLPPSPVADDSIDLVVNHSVFTHLPEDVQHAWLADIRRMMRPGGIAILSFHNRKTWAEYREAMRNNGSTDDYLQRADRDFHRNGFFYCPGRNEFEGALPDYYGAALHSIDYIDRQWSAYFEILAWIPRGSLNFQDIVIVRKN